MSQPNLDFKVGLSDWAGAQLGTSGNPIFTSVTGAGSGGTSSVDESTFTAGTSAFTATGGAFNDSAAALTSGQQGITRSTANRALHVNLRRPDGTEVVPASFAADASAWTTGVTTFSPGGGVFNDSAAALTSGQQGTLRLTAQRGVHTNLRTTAGADMGLTNNGAAPAALTNLGMLGALANAAAPAWTEGRLVTLSADLAGNLRTQGAQANGATIASNPFLAAMNDTGGVVRLIGSANAVLPTTGTGLLGAGMGVWDTTNWQKALADTSGRQMIVGSVAHGATDAGNPLGLGAQAIAHGANPTAVTAGQRTQLYANRAGVPFFIGGHPNIQTIAQNFTAAQTDTAIITVAAGTKIVVTGFLITCHNANSVNVAARLGFGTANTPAYGSAQLIGTHPGIAAGSGFGRGGGSGIIGVGADDEDLRFTCGVPTGGSIDIDVSYYTVSS